MKRPRARWRWWLKWTGALTCAFVVAAWVTSRCLSATYSHGISQTRAFWVVFDEDSLDVGWTTTGRVPRSLRPSNDVPPWTQFLHGRSYHAFRARSLEISSDGVVLPLWFPLVFIAPPTAWLWWRDRQARTGCTKCGYSLEGLPAASPCPECGTPPSSSLNQLRRVAL